MISLIQNMKQEVVMAWKTILQQFLYHFLPTQPRQTGHYGLKQADRQ